MSKHFDRRITEYDEEHDYGEKLHREKTKKVKRGKSRYFDDYEYQPPRRDKPSKRQPF